MNFIEEFKKGKEGGNKGLFMGDGVANISSAVNGLQKGRIYGVAAAPKAGKSTFVDYAFLIEPFLYAVANNVNVKWVYYSFEIDRVSKEFDIATYFLYHDYQITNVQLENGITQKGQSVIPLSPNYLRGRLQDDNGNIIQVKESIEEVLKQIYVKRIIPLFGEYASNGTQLKSGCIDFIEQKDNPTGIYKGLKAYAEKHGKFITRSTGKGQRIVGYRPNNDDVYTIIITDHLRKLIPERGFQMKQTVDKYIEYSVELRNWCNYTFVHIIHTNRGMTQSDRLKFFKGNLFPTSDDIKDTGNLAEDADYVFTMLNPNDDRYNLEEHFGIPLKDKQNNRLYPNLRTVHLVESRHCEYPQHFKLNMFGHLKSFSQLNV